MNVVIQTIILDMLENYINELVIEGKQRLIEKIKYRKFLKKMDKAISDYCTSNECYYINSDAFQTFIQSTWFIKKTVERSIDITIDKSDMSFIESWIDKARDISLAKGISFSVNEENVIKGLYKTIENELIVYHNKVLTYGQKAILARNLKEFARLNDSVNEIRGDNQKDYRDILKAIGEVNTIGDSKAELLSDVIISSIWDGRFETINILSKALEDKNTDLDLLFECIEQCFLLGETIELNNKIARIKNPTIRDNVIRAIIPILFLQNENITCYKTYVTGYWLKEIVIAIDSDDFSRIFNETISKEVGIEIHRFEFKKNPIIEEEWLAKNVGLIYLYKKKLLYIDALRELNENINTWFSKVIYIDKYMDYISTIDKSAEVISTISSYCSSLELEENIYKSLCPSIQIIFFSVFAKKRIICDEIKGLEEFIPNHLRMIRPLSDYILLEKIENKTSDLAYISDYCKKNGVFWILNDYFGINRNPNLLIDYCKENEDVFQNNWILFFMFLGALKVCSLNDERKYYLRKYELNISSCYEYWNELLDIDESENIRKNFINAAANGEMSFFINHSLFLLIERLINYKEYDLADVYIKKAELLVGVNFKLYKYRGLIEQNRGKHIDAIGYYKESFKLNHNDTDVLDSLITLSLLNKRKVDDDILQTARKIGTSRLQLLVSECYKQNGDDNKAKEEALRSILHSDLKIYNPAIDRFLNLEMSSKNDSVRQISCIDVNTAALCMKGDGESCYLCIHEELVLPESPYFWNGDYHVYVDDAAAFGYIRKCKNATVTIEGVEYVVKEIIPLELYFVRLCIDKMTDQGIAKTFAIPVKSDGCVDETELIKLHNDYMPDEKNNLDWFDDYNDFSKQALPLYSYQRCTNKNYLQFIDLLLMTDDFLIRDYIEEPLSKSSYYIISFTALVLLHKIGFPSSCISEYNGFITTSTLMQIKSDATEIIKNYDRDTVATMGVFDGKLFVNETDDTGKAYWLREAGEIKKYCKGLSTIDAEHDLDGKLEYKDIFGICDYDAISFVCERNDFSVVSAEGLLSFATVDIVNENRAVSIIDWFIFSNMNVVELIGYIRRMMNMGCFSSFSKTAVIYISNILKEIDKDKRIEIYEAFDRMIMDIETYSQKKREIAISTLVNVFGQLEDVANDLEFTLLSIFIEDIARLQRIKVQFYLDADNELTYSVINLDSEN